MDDTMHGTPAGATATTCSEQGAEAAQVSPLQGASERSGASTQAEVSVDLKVIATLRARAALAGYELDHLTDGTFLVRRWNLFRHLAHITAVEDFLGRAGAGHEI